MSMREAAKHMLVKKYMELEELFEEIEIYEFIVQHDSVAEEMEELLRSK